MNPTTDAHSNPRPASRALDVRPILAAGDEPLQLILETAADVPEGGVLEITAPFEPIPLYSVLGDRGFVHRTEMRGLDEFIVRFIQTGVTADSTVAEVYERHPAAAPVLAEHGLDLCCGGGHTLEFAARAHGLEPEELIAAVRKAVAGEG